MEVCKEITISTAHMLSGHNGLCKNLHGHNYKVCVNLLGGVSDEEGSSTRMVMDFKDLKGIVKRTIEDVFDHAIVFSSEKLRSEPENELLDWAIRWEMRYYVMPFGRRSTAEDMAYVMARLIRAEIETARVCRIGVTLWETPTSYAYAEAIQ